MTSKERQQHILDALKAAAAPISAGTFSRELSVSRQVIVGDIALLRAGGEGILSTPRGYICDRKAEGLTRILACCHRPEDTFRELESIVYFGGEVVDVIVSHPLYGQISAPLNISSRHDAEEFTKKVEHKGAVLLSGLTEGIHLHTIRVKNEEVYENICRRLDELGLLYHSTD